MGIKTLKCTSCGADIELDDSREFGFCKFCGTKLMLVEKVEIKHTGTVSVDGIQSVKEKIDNYNIIAKNSFLENDYIKARSYLEMILKLDSKNSLAWLNLCKIIVVQPKKNVERDTKQFALYANNCFIYASSDKKMQYTKQLTEIINDFIEMLLCTIEDDGLAIVPFDFEILWGFVPSVQYNPLAYLDNYFLLTKECVDTFKQKVNPEYSFETFSKLWDEFYYNISCKITEWLINSIKKNRSFFMYEDQLRMDSKFVDFVTYNNINNSLWGYKSALTKMYKNLQYKDLLKIIGETIIYVDQWLLKIKGSQGVSRARNWLTSQQKRELKDEINYVKSKINSK